MNKESPLMQLLFTNGIEVRFNTKVSRRTEKSLDDSIITSYNSASHAIFFPKRGGDIKDFGTAEQSSVVVHSYPAPFNCFFLARTYNEFHKPLNAIYTLPDLKGYGRSTESASICDHLLSTVGIKEVYELFQLTSNGLEKSPQTLLEMRIR